MIFSSKTFVLTLRRAAMTYALRPGFVHAFAGIVATAALAATALAAAPVHIVCLGDSLTAGYQLPADAAFPIVLEKALRAAGKNVDVANAGVSGDTSSGGLERLDWSVPDGTDIVILELGANDMLRGIDPKLTQTSLNTIMARLNARHIRVLLAGMRATPGLGKDYASQFNAIFPNLAKKFDVPLVPFFLEGVAGHEALQLPDQMHPNRSGVEVIVRHMLPSVEAMLAEKSADIKP